MSRGPGFHRGIPMAEYQAIDAMGSGRLEWLEISALHYRYRLTQPPEETPSLSLGTAVHVAVLEPELFEKAYVLEPLDVAADNVKPRATKAYKEAVAELEQGGRTVLRKETMEQVRAMAAAVHDHVEAAALLKRCPERELTMLWNIGRPCRGRLDMLGETARGRAVGDLKTTRSLKDFSPWAVTRFGYHRQAAWYEEGLRALDRGVDHYYLLAVESDPPYDVGVFAFEPEARIAGAERNAELIRRLVHAEETGIWPGQFPKVASATVTGELLMSLGEEVAS